MKKFNFGNFLFNMIVALFASLIFAIPAFAAIGGAVAGGTALSFMNNKDIVRAGLLKEIWTDQIMEGFYPADHFMAEGRDMSALVEYNKINLAEAGANPEVLIDNTSYPIAVSSRTDVPKELALKTLDTTSTVVRNIEQMELAYDKMQSVIYGHKKELQRTAAKLSAWNWCPASNAANTPVITATGALANGYKKLTFADVLTMRNKFDMNDWPDDGRVLVLHPIHEANLIAEDLALYKAVMNNSNLFGFKPYRTSVTPVFNATTGVKAAYGAAPAGTDTISSFFFHKDEVMKAIGTIEMFYTLKDPANKGDIVNFQMRFCALPLRAKAIGAVYSALS